MQATTIGLDLAKHWFQVHGVDASGAVAIRRKLRRSEVLRSLPPCLVGIEACATAHHWARELIRLGHEVKLMPPAYIKAYVKRNKNDAADVDQLPRIALIAANLAAAMLPPAPLPGGIFLLTPSQSGRYGTPSPISVPWPSSAGSDVEVEYCSG